MCPAISAPPNGGISFNPGNSEPFDYDTMATYTCEAGFGLNRGDPLRICSGDGSSIDGTWTGNMPSCDRELI